MKDNIVNLKYISLKRNLHLYLILMLSIICCNITGQSIATDSVYDKTEILCDSVLKINGFKMFISTINQNNEDESIKNTVFTLQKLKDGQYTDFYIDSIYSKLQRVEFVDFNNDNIKDILIHNSSSARSNWTYHLYVIDLPNNRILKIKNFNTIANPKFQPKYNIIESYVCSGVDRLNFFGLVNDSIYDYDITIYDNHRADNLYKLKYLNAIRKILKIQRLRLINKKSTGANTGQTTPAYGRRGLAFR